MSKGKKQEFTADRIGVDVSTTKFTIAVRDSSGNEDVAAVDMRGATLWHGQPAFDLNHLPYMMKDVLDQLVKNGWHFDKPGALSLDVRQHDTVFLGRDGRPLLPALSWQCVGAKEETKWINGQKELTDIVGKVEERFLLPKTVWAADQEPNLWKKIRTVFTTGDYISFQLTGYKFISASDGVCNGLLQRETKTVADEVIRKCGLETFWFPGVVKSGAKIGLVREIALDSSAWRGVCRMLKGWTVVSFLGDNHAGAVGCGLDSDNTIVASFGSSGTVVRLKHPGQQWWGSVSLFEYYDDDLLLVMMERCAVWYVQFTEKVRALSPELTHKKIDEAIMKHIKSGALLPLIRIEQKQTGKGMIEIYPDDWEDYPLSFQAAAVQASIALEMLLLVKIMLAEVPAKVEKVVLTGGLTQSIFLREVFLVGLEILQPDLKLFVSAHEGPLASKASAFGALINADIGYSGGNYLEVIRKNCPTSQMSSCGYGQKAISTFLKKYL